MQDYLISVRKANRLIYWLIIGLSITNAIKILFTVGDKFTMPSFQGVLLFIVFFSFISRFFLGAYRVLSYDIDVEVRRGKIILDVIAFFLQSLAFFVYSLNFYDPFVAQWMVIIICGLDLVWLVLLASCFRIMEDTFAEWLIHALAMPSLIALNIFIFRQLWIFVVAAALGFLIDFFLNFNFYFSVKLSKGLRIFVAGPYGDMGPKEKIAENVERAESVGKALALKGHFPLIPHTMLHGWEKDPRFSVKHFKAIDFKWLEFCDALFFLGESPGAIIEREIAIKKGLQIFTELDQVPDISSDKPPKF
jgi:hypothetical protein